MCLDLGRSTTQPIRLFRHLFLFMLRHAATRERMEAVVHVAVAGGGRLAHNTHVMHRLPRCLLLRLSCQVSVYSSEVLRQLCQPLLLGFVQ